MQNRKWALEHQQQAISLSKQGLDAEAIAYYQSSLEFDNTIVDTHVELAYLLFRKGLLKKAYT